MMALIVYDTATGMTERIAQAISSGMKEVGAAVLMRKADAATEEDFRSAQAWIVGSPTHFGTATGATKRALRKGLATGAAGKKGTAFDTRYAKMRKGAALKIMAMMEDGGMVPLQPPEWFTVLSGQGPLAEGEEARAVAFGRRIAGALRP